jgi:hypothetical protein
LTVLTYFLKTGTTEKFRFEMQGRYQYMYDEFYVTVWLLTSRMFEC